MAVGESIVGFCLLESNSQSESESEEKRKIDRGSNYKGVK
jgi:hypothetical protein